MTIGSKPISGSFVVSGECYTRLEKVGNEFYISKLSTKVKSLESRINIRICYSGLRVSLTSLLSFGKLCLSKWSAR